MIKYYFKQALTQLRQQPVISLVSVLGTALAIFLIMLVVMIQQVKVASFSPENSRDRFLHVRYMSIGNKQWGDGSSNGPMSVQTAKACFKSLATPKAVTVYSVGPVTTPASIPGVPAVSIDMRETDDTFWKVFDFVFIDGKPYDQATFEAGRPVAVLTESVARVLFGTAGATGREFLLNYAPYKVAGVVKDVSTLADAAYGQIWVPYTSTNLAQDTWCDNHMGMMSVTILAHSRSDFAVIREESEKVRRQYNNLLAEQGYELISRNRPYDQETQSIAFAANWEPDLASARRQRMIIFIILLLVPAINLSSMTQSRLRQRVSEIGVRRAFGSTRTEMMNQIIMENFILTLLAGIIGLIFSILFAYFGNTLLFAQAYSSTLNPPNVNATMLLQPSTFMYALLFCFILNLLSSIIPAWKASRTSIVNALGGKVY